MSTKSLTESLFSLPLAERVTLADQLYASVPEKWLQEADRAWLAEAERRSAEMDEDASAELSHEEFLAGLELKRPKG